MQKYYLTIKDGKLSVDLKLQYNKLQDNISYEFTPVIQQVQKEKLLTPFIRC